MLEIIRYTAAKANEWNQFVSKSKNGTFLFDRLYMDYHADRFQDYSLMVYRNGALYALMPANVTGDTFVTHGGLTYGGLVTSSKCSASGVIEVFEAINDKLRHEGLRRVVYKAIPWIYHLLPAEEDLYALTNNCHAQLMIRDISSVIVRPRILSFSESRKSGLRKAIRSGLVVRENQDIDAFWPILEENLTTKYGVHAVHSANELKLLQSRFPDEIKLWMVYQGDTPLGGTLLYLTRQVLHTQYISATREGKACGAIDLLFNVLINDVYKDYHYIDFGKSTVSDSAQLNYQLIFQKEGFGARAVCYDTYEWML